MAREELRRFQVHAGDRNPDNVLRCLLDGRAQLLREAANSRLRRIPVEADGAVAEFAGAQEAQNRKGVGDGGPFAAAAIAGGARRRTGAFGANLQNAERINGGDGAPALSDVVLTSPLNREQEQLHLEKERARRMG